MSIHGQVQPARQTYTMEFEASKSWMSEHIWDEKAVAKQTGKPAW